MPSMKTLQNKLDMDMFKLMFTFEVILKPCKLISKKKPPKNLRVRNALGQTIFVGGL